MSSRKKVESSSSVIYPRGRSRQYQDPAKLSRPSVVVVLCQNSPPPLPVAISKEIDLARTILIWFLVKPTKIRFLNFLYLSFLLLFSKISFKYQYKIHIQDKKKNSYSLPYHFSKNSSCYSPLNHVHHLQIPPSPSLLPKP